ncbi:DUF4156 domain-containing protein [Legionella micdadei]|uniref:Cytochrome c type biogenesis protein CycH n=1 Tax=Legionella micdadei TaxID=451 RepID=A0A098GJZ9_LEGMI|nr:DUF4156 domain-containing protein [Legionella micdadei]ARG96780.1 hypothetical protein B6N58_03365 [Legionella micdadei]ARG99514.1 hypothetical protein B6V88_03280 [Legionella micdadei]KTD26451.1 cytochrome c type biogenesis protein CycH [Legionella micdadei]NSL17957.1 DUF4156 domain-containing protein [Legionella micdadei]CEG61831.1 Cytochrome c type biogenesis protein CycH [Legionella micdadei]
MKKLLSISAITLILSGCAAIPTDPQATRVIVSPNPVPKGCKYVGQVVGNQGNFFTGGFTSNRNLEEGAMNDLRNKAAKLGANYVQLVTNRAGVTGSTSGSFDRHGGFVSGGSQQTNVTNLGNAYVCSPKMIGLE